MKRSLDEANSVIRVLSRDEAIARMGHDCPEEMVCMYSSQLGGIVVDKALMQVPLDDHLCHRGHCVFDTCSIFNGKLYALEMHLNRFYLSAAAAKIHMPYSREEIRKIIMATVKVGLKQSSLKNLYCRMWLSAGRGNFNITPAHAKASSFYIIVQSKGDPATSPVGLHEVTVDVPMKSQLLATMKSNNYLINALVALQAQEKGGSLGMQLDSAGNIGELAIGSVAFISKEKYFYTPKLDTILDSTTLKRVVTFVLPKLIKEGVIKGYEFRDIAATYPCSDECAEMITFGGSFVRPVVTLDGKPIGDGKIGNVFRKINEILCDDYLNGDLLEKIE